MTAVGDVVLYGVSDRDAVRFFAQRTHRCRAEEETARFVAGDVLPAMVVAGGPTVVNLQVLNNGPTSFFVKDASPGAANTRGAYWPHVQPRPPARSRALGAGARAMAAPQQPPGGSGHP